MDERIATKICERSPVAGAETEEEAPSYLILLNGAVPGSMFRLQPGSNRMGRASDNHIQLLEASLSRHHALVDLIEDGSTRLTDLGSTNGTFLNAQPLDRWEPTLLRDGDRIRVGGHLMLKYARPDPFEERFQREMFERAMCDPLTGLFNRAYFFDHVAQVAGRAAGRGIGVAVLMLDIDHFKRINDTHGHLAGDRVLREVAGVFRQVLRSDDLVARFGGEEFVAVLPVERADTAIDRAERVRRVVRERVVAFQGRSIRATCSIGVAHHTPGTEFNPTALVGAADRALYLAKRGGRDRVLLAEEMALAATGTG
jgi:diguanylate cyclase (GGDEF)-like protein